MKLSPQNLFSIFMETAYISIAKQFLREFNCTDMRKIFANFAAKNHMMALFATPASSFP